MSSENFGARIFVTNAEIAGLRQEWLRSSYGQFAPVIEGGNPSGLSVKLEGLDLSGAETKTGEVNR